MSTHGDMAIVDRILYFGHGIIIVLIKILTVEFFLNSIIFWFKFYKKKGLSFFSYN